LQQNIQPTAVFDPEATQAAREEARLNTPPTMISILEGQTIVFEGEIVNSDDIAILQRLGLLYYFFFSICKFHKSLTTPFDFLTIGGNL